ncbi:MAG TPA: hypothetical protein VFU23_15465, partial [Gemmatimonadales bacterium]|nr:hypothetical protein [Gemmatimonadales bacterium]
LPHHHTSLRHLYLGAHILGFVLWMGGGLAAMTVGIALRRGPRNDVPALLGVQERLHRTLILPGSVLVVVSGLLLTLRLYSTATSVNGYPLPLMIMQGAGLLAAGIVLIVSLPTIGRLTRLDPAGPHAALFQALSRKLALAGSLSGLLALVALIGGVLLR